MDVVERASLCNCVVNFLLEEKYLLSAFELLHELLEDGREAQAIRLKEFFSDPSHFPPDQISRFNSLRDPQSLLEEKEALEEKLAISGYELRLAQEDILKLKTELEKKADFLPNSSKSNSDVSVDHGQDIQRQKRDASYSDLGPLKDNERRDLNCAVKEYLLLAGYRLTAMTFYEEVIDQNLDVWQNTPACVPDALRHYYYQYLSSTAEAAELSLFRMPRVVARRLEKLQRDFLWGGGSTERKAHLVNWERVCVGKEKGGLGLRKLVPLNKALLGKWVWRFARAKEEMWKRVLVAKYGQEEFGWRTKKVNGAFGVGVWKEIMKEADWCWDNMNFKVGKGTKIRFWKDPWCGDVELARRFPQLFNVAAQRSATVGDIWDQNSGQGSWNLRFIRGFNDWELNMVDELLQILRSQRITLEEDLALWKGGKNGKFDVKEAYGLLISHSTPLFPKKGIWVENVPSKLAFFAWEATWGRVLTLDRLQKRGWQFPNRCYLCGNDEENVNHLLIHCTVASVLWGIVLSLFGAQ